MRAREASLVLRRMGSPFEDWRVQEQKRVPGSREIDEQGLSGRRRPSDEVPE